MNVEFNIYCIWSLISVSALVRNAETISKRGWSWIDFDVPFWIGFFIWNIVGAIRVF